MFDEEERLVYETRMQSLADVESKIASAEEKGREKGREKERHDMALKLVQQGVAINVIAEVSGLTETEITHIFQQTNLSDH